MKLTKKKLSTLIEKTYYKAAEGKTINILNIPKIFKAGEEAYAKESTEEAVIKAVQDAAEIYCIKGDDNTLEAMYS